MKTKVYFFNNYKIETKQPCILLPYIKKLRNKKMQTEMEKMVEERFNRLVRPLYNEEKYLVWMQGCHYHKDDPNQPACKLMLFERPDPPETYEEGYCEDAVCGTCDCYDERALDYGALDLQGVVVFLSDNPDDFRIWTEDDYHDEDYARETAEEQQTASAEDAATYETRLQEAYDYDW